MLHKVLKTDSGENFACLLAQAVNQHTGTAFATPLDVRISPKTLR